MKYEIKEITIGAMLPIMGLIETDSKQFQLEMVKQCVYKDGKPLGDEALNLPISEYMSLAVKVMEVNDLGGGKEGKS